MRAEMGGDSTPSCSSVNGGYMLDCALLPPSHSAPQPLLSPDLMSNKTMVTMEAFSYSLSGQSAYFMCARLRLLCVSLCTSVLCTAGAVAGLQYVLALGNFCVRQRGYIFNLGAVYCPCVAAFAATYRCLFLDCSIITNWIDKCQACQKTAC